MHWVVVVTAWVALTTGTTDALHRAARHKSGAGQSSAGEIHRFHPHTVRQDEDHFRGHGKVRDGQYDDDDGREKSVSYTDLGIRHGGEPSDGTEGSAEYVVTGSHGDPSDGEGSAEYVVTESHGDPSDGEGSAEYVVTGSHGDPSDGEGSAEYGVTESHGDSRDEEGSAEYGITGSHGYMGQRTWDGQHRGEKGKHRHSGGHGAHSHVYRGRSHVHSDKDEKGSYQDVDRRNGHGVLRHEGHGVLRHGGHGVLRHDGHGELRHGGHGMLRHNHGKQGDDGPDTHGHDGQEHVYGSLEGNAGITDENLGHRHAPHDRAHGRQGPHPTDEGTEASHVTYQSRGQPEEVTRTRTRHDKGYSPGGKQGNHNQGGYDRRWHRQDKYKDQGEREGEEEGEEEDDDEENEEEGDEFNAASIYLSQEQRNLWYELRKKHAKDMQEVMANEGRKLKAPDHQRTNQSLRHTHHRHGEHRESHRPEGKKYRPTEPRRANHGDVPRGTPRRKPHYKHSVHLERSHRHGRHRHVDRHNQGKHGRRAHRGSRKHGRHGRRNHDVMRRPQRREETYGNHGNEQPNDRRGNDRHVARHSNGKHYTSNERRDRGGETPAESRDHDRRGQTEHAPEGRKYAGDKGSWRDERVKGAWKQGDHLEGESHTDMALGESHDPSHGHNHVASGHVQARKAFGDGGYGHGLNSYGIHSFAKTEYGMGNSGKALGGHYLVGSAEFQRALLTGFSVPVHAYDENNDGVPDALDMNRDGKLDSL